MYSLSVKERRHSHLCLLYRTKLTHILYTPTTTHSVLFSGSLSPSVTQSSWQDEEQRRNLRLQVSIDIIIGKKPLSSVPLLRLEGGPLIRERRAPLEKTITSMRTRKLKIPGISADSQHPLAALLPGASYESPKNIWWKRCWDRQKWRADDVS